MAFQEKNAWVSAVALLLVFVPYFHHIATTLPGGQLTFGEIGGMLIGATILMIIICTLTNILLALRNADQRTDERDKAIERRSTRLAHWVLQTGCMLLVLGAFALPSALILSQVLFLCVVTSELTYYITQIACYRAGQA